MPESAPAPVPKEVEQPKLVGLTKRQQLEKTSKTIFIWVAVAGVVVALSIVLMQFLVRQALFNHKVISQKQETSKRLDANLANADGLKRNVDALLADVSLSRLRVREQDSVLQVIPDSLPTSGDPVSFSNSLYNKVLQRSGASISEVSVGVTSADAAAGVTTTPTEAVAVTGRPVPVSLPFSFTISGSQDQVSRTLIDLDKTIRPIAVTQMKVAAGEGGVLTVSVVGETYYLPRTTVKPGEVTIKP
jgi:hypothetical protein